jgi:hypothetical protein
LTKVLVVLADVMASSTSRAPKLLEAKSRLNFFAEIVEILLSFAALRQMEKYVSVLEKSP